MTARFSRTRHDLAEFLRRKRASVQPEDVGLPRTARRRTPGLRREEVATVAGIGLSWYTWLEQGRAISVSAHLLENVARALRMTPEERQHLYLLAQNRLPAAPAQSWCEMPPLIRRLLDDLTERPAFVMNLRWDVIGWNAAGDGLFAFSDYPAGSRNMLWMYFADDRLSRRVQDWPRQAPQIVASFRRDYAAGKDAPDMQALADHLQATSRTFRRLWHDHDVQGRCEGRRSFDMADRGPVAFDHTTLIVDQDRHLRLVYYAATERGEAGRKSIGEYSTQHAAE
ncbi:helix-turn-helix domain-containing protein [Rhodovulum sulfidophilum]|uniref:Helix-turn-helix domain-containing protein n=1 Tax=Rhodovulum sulfidophilum TaxID=35806 RepID=A0A0D6B6D6_RHOSU|nr:helix-turn-helix domain-containing protein [Rhodovulum sulfidophilum]